MESNVIKRRLTAFIGCFVGCTADNIKKLAEAFPLSYVFADRQEDGLRPISEARANAKARRWEVKTEKGHGGSSIIFGGTGDGKGRVDVVTQVLLKKGVDETVEMAEVLRRAFGALGIDKIWRIAYNPLTAVDDSDTFSTDEFFRRKFGMPKIDGMSPSLQEMRVLYTLDKQFAGRADSVNIVCTLCKGIKINDKTNERTLCTMFNVDMSTRAEENGEYSIDDMKAFAKAASEWKRETIKATVE